VYGTGSSDAGNNLNLRNTLFGAGWQDSVGSLYFSNNGSGGANPSQAAIWKIESFEGTGNPTATWVIDSEITNANDGAGCPLASDPVMAAIEDAGPNNGDGNGDGIPDSEQDHVASIPDATGTGSYVTLEITSGDCAAITSIKSLTEEEVGVDDVKYSYPAGLIDFTTKCVAAGSTANITFYWHGLSGSNAFRKYGSSTPGGSDFIYKNFAVTSGSKMIGSTMVPNCKYSITDNMPGDDSAMAGEIIDPTGPALLATCSGTISTINQPLGSAAGSPNAAAQSFTAAVTGDILQIGTGIINPTSDLTLNIYSGEGTTGSAVYTQTLNIADFPTSGTATTLIEITTPFAVTASNIYTVEFVSTNTFGIRAFSQTPNGPITNGSFYLDGALGTADQDMQFQLDICPTAPAPALDSDGDLVPDATDIDDDNDGITDTDECPQGPNANFSQFTGVQNAPGTTTTGTITQDGKLINFTITHPAKINPFDGQYAADTRALEGLFSDPDIYAPVNPVGIFEHPKFGNTGTYTIVFDQPITNPRMNIWSLGDGGFFSGGSAPLQPTFTFNTDITVISSKTLTTTGTDGTTNSLYQTASNTVRSNDDSDWFGGNGTIEILGTFTTVSFTVDVFEQFWNMNFSVFDTIECDFDGDGIPARLDLDSDGDGCPDAVEAGVSPTTGIGNGDVINGDGTTNTTTSIANAQFTFTEAGGDGLLNSIDGATVDGNTEYTSTYVRTAIDDTVNGCSDNDNDGVDDLTDIDDDNDGIIDTEESPNCFYTEAEATGNDLVKITSILTSPDDDQTDGDIQLLSDGATTATFNFNAGQAIEFAELFKIEFPTPVDLTSVTIDNNTTFGVATTAKLQVSNDGYNWTDASTTNSIATNANKVFTNTQTGNNNLFYRIVGVSDGNNLESVTSTTIREITWIAAGNYNAASHPKPTCTDDTDGDGIYNHLDLDSDGDGCPDAVEAGASVIVGLANGDVINGDGTSNTTTDTAEAQFSFVSPTNDTNGDGLFDAADGATQDGVTEYASTYNFAINATQNACLDTDNDGIGDLVDIDDDNDGVLDSVEDFCTTTNLVTNGSFNVATTIAQGWTLIQGNVAQSATDNIALTGGIFEETEQNDDGSGGLMAIATNNTNVLLSYELPALLENVTYDIAFDVEGNSASMTANNLLVEIWNDTQSTQTAVVYNTNIQDAGIGNPKTISSSFRIPDAADTYLIRWYGLGNGTTTHDFRIDRVAVIGERCITDTDNDGIPNRLDLDSDGDGCPDAVEAGVNPATNLMSGDVVNGDGTTNTTTATDDARFVFVSPANDTNNNGLADEVENGTTGTISYISTYYLATNNLLNGCADADNDGVPDVVDIDDDNDGILDTTELNCGIGYSTITSETTLGNSQSAAGQFIKGNSIADYTINFTDVNLNFSASNNVLEGNGIHYILNDNDADGDFSEDISITADANSVISSVLYGPEAPVNPAAIANKDNDQQTMVVTWNPAVPATIIDPDNQLDVTDGDSLISGSTIVQTVDLVNTVATWRIEFHVNMLSNFNLTITHDHNTANAIAFESYGFNVSLCEKLNTDSANDALLNHLDIDSDNDGCSDAFEAGATTDKTANFVFTNTLLNGEDTNGNGLADSIEDLPANPGQVNYTSTDYLAYSATLNGCTDTDTDGVPDFTDIDDDNDGILDTTELACGVAIASTTNTVLLAGTQQVEGTFTRGVAAVNYDLQFQNLAAALATANIVTNTSGFHYIVDDIDQGSYEMSMTFTPQADAILNTVEWGPDLIGHSDTENDNDEQYITINWNPTIGATIIDPDNQLDVGTTDIVDGQAITAGTTITQVAEFENAAPPTWKIVFNTNLLAVPFTINTSHIALPSANLLDEGYSFVANVCNLENTDSANDAIPNHLDLDSDNDGCSDAKEASATTDDTANYAFPSTTLSGDANGNGLADVIEDTANDGQINYVSSHLYAIADGLNLCDDFDNDLVPDIVDIDDDNDGILDANESPLCFFSDDELGINGGNRIFLIEVASDLTINAAANVLTNTVDASTTTVTRFTNAQSVTDKNIISFKFRIPVELDELVLNYANTSSIFNSTNTAVNETNVIVQGSNDASFWVNLALPKTVGRTAETGNVNTFPITQNAAQYQYYRLLGTSGNTYSTGQINNATFNVTNFNASEYPKASCLDNEDGLLGPNHQDLDSDEDGCFDTYEAGVTGATFDGSSSTDSLAATTPAEVGANGYADALETTENGINNDPQNFTIPYDVNFNLCADSDNDGIGDLVDKDDDNDGIIDDEEGCITAAPGFTFGGDFSYSAGSISDTSGSQLDLSNVFDYVSLSGGDPEPNGDIYVNGFDQVGGASTFSFVYDSPNKIEVASVLTVRVFFYNAIQSNPNPSFTLNPIITLQTAQGNFTLTHILTASEKTALAAQQWIPLEFNVPVTSNFLDISGFTVSIEQINGGTIATFNPLNSEVVGLSVLEVVSDLSDDNCTLDTDGDGIFNHLDLDSDGDGCPDAQEAGVTVITGLTTGSIINGNGTTNTTTPGIANAQFSFISPANDTNEDGLFDLADGATQDSATEYASTYVLFALNDTRDACFDTDNDGIGDLVDIDDDNDGILDVAEQTTDCAYVGGEDLSTYTFTGSANSIITTNTNSLVANANTGSWRTTYSDQTLSLPVHLEFKVDAVASPTMFGLIPVSSPAVINNWNDNSYKFYNSSITANDVRVNGAVSASGTYTATTLFEIDIDEAGNVSFKRDGVEVHTVAGAPLVDYKLSVSTATTVGRTYNDIVLGNLNNLLFVCTDLDTDDDGIVNRLDLDSDGDGCPDAVEAGVAPTTGIGNGDLENGTGGTVTSTTSTADAQFTFTQDAGNADPDTNNDGLIDSVDDNGGTGTLDSVIEYPSTYSTIALSSTLNACADFDNDLVPDLVDIDDDNDGVLDAVESPACFYTEAEVTIVNASNTTTDFTISTNTTIDFDKAFDGDSATYARITAAESDITGMSLIEFTSPASVLIVAQLAIEVGGVRVSNGTTGLFQLEGFNGNSWIALSVSQHMNTINTTYTFENTLQTTQAYSQYRIAGVSGGAVVNARIEEVVFTASNYQASLNTKPTCVDPISDGDTDPPHLDLDSDGDGCSDAKEANATTDDTTDFAFTSTTASGDTNGNGLADSIEDLPTNEGTINYVSSYQFAQDATQDACIDTDNDGIGDLVDIDDDNDGVLDVDECTETLSLTNIIGETSPTTINGNTSNVVVTYPTGLTPFDGNSASLPGFQFNSATFLETEYDFSFPVNNLEFILYDLDQNEFFEIEAFDENNASVNISDFYELGDDVTLNVSEFTGTTSSAAFAINSNQSIQFKFSNQLISRILIRARETVTGSRNYATSIISFDSDPDRDGIISCLDLDSDGDGCPDAVEADGPYQETDLADATGVGLLDGGNSGPSYTGSPSAGEVLANFGTTSDANGQVTQVLTTTVAPLAQTIGDSQDGSTNNCAPADDLDNLLQ